MKILLEEGVDKVLEILRLFFLENQKKTVAFSLISCYNLCR